MRPERTRTINGKKVSEYYWAGEYHVYVDNQLVPGTFEAVCASLATNLPNEEEKEVGNG